MGKKMIILRHARKNLVTEGNVELINKSVLQEIKTNGIPSLNKYIELHPDQQLVFHKGGTLKRTEQCINAFADYLKNCSNPRFPYDWIESDSRFGNQNIIDYMIQSDTCIINESKRSNWYTSFNKFDRSFLIKTQQDLAEAVKYNFLAVPEDSIIIQFGHSPLIEWLAYALDPQNKLGRDIKLKELTGFVITQEGEIEEVAATIGFQIILT